MLTGAPTGNVRRGFTTFRDRSEAGLGCGVRSRGEGERGRTQSPPPSAGSKNHFGSPTAPPGTAAHHGPSPPGVTELPVKAVPCTGRTTRSQRQPCLSVVSVPFTVGAVYRTDRETAAVARSRIDRPSDDRGGAKRGRTASSCCRSRAHAAQRASDCWQQIRSRRRSAPIAAAAARNTDVGPSRR